jgi:outer membrane protein assembly factor BamB
VTNLSPGVSSWNTHLLPQLSMKISHLIPSFSQTAAMIFCTTMTVTAKDWTQWRGEQRQGHSSDTELLKAWPKEGPKRVWLFENSGKGYSGPSIASGKIFIMGTREDMTQLICLNEADGKELWSTDLDVVYSNRWGDGPRSTPTVDGDLVYALSGKGSLICAKISDGSVVWKKNLVKDFDGEVQSWGYTESVLIDGDRLICTPGGKKGAIIALNKQSGDLAWASSGLTDNAQYSSPIVIEHDGRRQYAQLFMKTLAGVDAENGKLLWQTSFPGRTAVIPTPIYADGKVYVTAGYGAGCKQIKLGKEEPDVVYENEEMVNHHGGVILIDGHLYGHSDKGGWTCQNFETGEAVWKNDGVGKGAIAYADGMLYCLSEKSGTVALIEATTEGWKEHGRFQLDPQTKIRSKHGKIWTHPVIANGRLYLRDQDLFFSFDVKG